MILVDRAGQKYFLLVGDNLIGRGADCQVRLEHERVSRRHAVVAWDGAQATITDLGSTNGTRLNGRPLEPQRPSALKPGDRLEIGSAENLLEVAPAAQPAAGVGGVPVGPGPAPKPARAFPLWLMVVGGILFLLLVFVLALLWSAHRARPAVTAPAAVETTLVAPSVAETPSSASGAALPTATLALPAAEGAQPNVNLGGAPAAAVAPAGPAALAGMPPVNPTTLPNLIAAGAGGLLPGDLTALLGGTPVPGLPGGTPGITVPAGPRRHSPPRLLNPDSGASYQGEDALIILEWAPVAGLAANEYYWVMVFYMQNGKEQAGGTWVKATSYRVPAWFLTQASGRFEWQVVIAEATGPVERGGRLGATTSDPSERRWFQWGPGAGSAPTPPVPTPTYGG